jgi:hypothetical protein
MADQIGGQIEAGFVITGFDEAPYHAESLVTKYLPGYFATRAVKPKGRIHPGTRRHYTVGSNFRSGDEKTM